jgi:acetyl-CoA carboxylase biotin carboxylase subunit
MESHRFHGGQFDTTFVEQRFSIDEDIPEELPRVAAIAATLVAHHRGQQAAQIVRGATHGVSNWKQAGRQELIR